MNERNDGTVIGLAYKEHVHPHLRHVGTFATCIEGPCTYYPPADREAFALAVDPEEAAVRQPERSAESDPIMDAFVYPADMPEQAKENIQRNWTRATREPERSAESVERANRLAGVEPDSVPIVIMPGAITGALDVPLTWGQGGPVIGHATVKADGTGLFQLSEPSAHYPRAEPTPEELPTPDNMKGLAWVADQLEDGRLPSRARFGLATWDHPFPMPSSFGHDAATCPECRGINGAAQEGVETIAAWETVDEKHERRRKRALWVSVGSAVVFVLAAVYSTSSTAPGAQVIGWLTYPAVFACIWSGLDWAKELGYARGRAAGLKVMVQALSKIDEMMAVAFPGSKGLTITDTVTTPEGVVTKESRVKDEG